MGALMTGVSFSRGLALGLKIPFLGLNHMEAHIFANFITYPELEFPFICLLVSGGHTQIWKVGGLGNYDLMGETRDDAAGEAFDKGARILGLGYPGGIEIEKAARGGNSTAVNFPRAFSKTDSIEFSFSGLKTSVKYYVDKQTRPLATRGEPYPSPTLTCHTFLSLAGHCWGGSKSFTQPFRSGPSHPGQ